MFDEKMMKNVVLTNLLLGVAVLFIAVANLVGTFSNSAAVVADDTVKPVAKQAQPARPAANADEKISQKYGKKSIDLEKALANNQGQYEALDAFLTEAQCSIESFNSADSDVSEDEIDMLINNQALDAESKIDEDIDQKIESIRKRMNG